MRTHQRTALLAICALLCACMSSREVQRRSNLMAYLYPDATAAPAPAPGTARLQLPLRIGIAFVPPEPTTRPHMQEVQDLFPPDAERRLVDIVRKSFEGRDWVSKIQMIPSEYLVRRGGFANLDQVARLMNVDVIALVSVDQLQTSDPRRTSFLYLSVLGAYVLPLDRNETRTLIDAAVFYVPTRTFLLRAPGVSSVTGSSTAMDVEASLRERSYRGFEMAMSELARNLNSEVDSFKQSIASNARADVDIVTAEGKSVRQGGDFGSTEALVAAAIAIAVALRRRR